MTITRKQYLAAAEALWPVFYSRAATPELIRRVVRTIGAERIAKSTDRYFNDLNDNCRQHSTDNWRDCVTIDEACAFNNLTETYPAHIKGCSDSDRVVIAKAAARKWLENPRCVVETKVGNDWENVWTEDDEPLTFDTPAAARTAIDEHIATCKSAGLTVDQHRIVAA